jgi:hypothetical protein
LKPEEVEGLDDADFFSFGFLMVALVFLRGEASIPAGEAISDSKEEIALTLMTIISYLQAIKTRN